MKQRGEKKIRPCIKARASHTSTAFLFDLSSNSCPFRERGGARVVSLRDVSLSSRFDKRNLDAWSNDRNTNEIRFSSNKDEWWGILGFSILFRDNASVLGMILSFLVRVGGGGANRWSIENEEGNEISFCTTFIVGHYFHRNFISRDVSISEYWQGNHRLTNVILFFFLSFFLSFFLFFLSGTYGSCRKIVYTNRTISRAIGRSCFFDGK